MTRIVLGVLLVVVWFVFFDVILQARQSLASADLLAFTFPFAPANCNVSRASSYSRCGGCSRAVSRAASWRGNNYRPRIGAFAVHRVEIVWALTRV